METYIIVSEKTWNKKLIEKLSKQLEANWVLIDNKKSFTIEHVNQVAPKLIFVPHWSYYIPEEIFENYECVVFHETDLPFGRGGSPIQNLIERGYQETKISALKVTKDIDAGDIYLKRSLSLHGTAEEIFIRINNEVEMMILEIIKSKRTPIPQKGEPTFFKRRKPAQSNIDSLISVEQIYDYIRMLDAEGYPNAFIETDKFRFEFSRASLKSNESIVADVRIIKK
ncbi:formyltransferase family protein [Marinifilum fragile]|uniref:formyltransferase family protein n=1 Tax=Marinifilum fragile TaxID=570161 RepID=UPI002AA75F15|nr:formyltransferase family protein [Marinifilum fragile]